MALPLLIGIGVALAGLTGANRYLRARRLAAMSPEERKAFLAAEEDRRHEIRNGQRAATYEAAIAGPAAWCLVAMREGRNYCRHWVTVADLPDIRAWAEANHIAVTQMDASPDGQKARISFGDLRRARARARFMPETP